jgi:DNA-binding response OmpR family regulator
MLKNLNILYAEDEDFIRENVVEALEFMSINVKAVSNGKDAYDEYLKCKPDIVIADIEMPLLNGLELAQKIRKIDNETQIVITTAYKNTDYLLKAVELNLVKYLLKPIHIIELKNVLTTCMRKIKKSNSVKYFNEKDYYDLNEHQLIENSEEVKLDYHERLFLELLLRNENHVVPYQQIESTIWEEGMSIASLRTLVKKIRTKLPENVIENISKTGYKVNIKR